MTDRSDHPARSSRAEHYGESDYRAAIRLVLLVATTSLVFLGFSDSIHSMMRIWNTDGFRHSYLIPIICVYLLWADRHEWEVVQPRPSWLGLPVLIFAIWLWLLARISLIQLLEHTAVIIAVHGTMISVYGLSMYRHMQFPLWFLFLLVPAGTGSIPWLMEFTADVAGVLLHAFGIPSLRQEMFFMLPGGNFEVAEACSGFRYVFSGFTLALLIAHLSIRTWQWKVAFVVISVICFLLMNGIRAALVMAIASATDMQYLSTDHIWFGWLLFGLTLVCLYAVVLRYSTYTPGGAH